jgi:L-asparaginase
MQSRAGVVVLLGTGGTIAGRSASALDSTGYAAAEIGVDVLLASVLEAVPALRDVALETEQVAQVDSKDMGPEVWRCLAGRAAAHLARPEVCALVVTHGTDTLEETAYFLHRVLAPGKPLVLVAAMRPATSLQADGPQNLFDAVRVARTPGARGVVAVLGGEVFHGVDLRKTHTWRLDAFEAGDAGLLGRIQAGLLCMYRPWPEGPGLGLDVIAPDPARWPRVEIVLNHAGADGRNVDALCAQGLDGLVLAGTGNGSLSAALEGAALRAQASGVRVLRASRCAQGPVTPAGSALAAAGSLSAVQARLELTLCLLAERLNPAPAVAPGPTRESA